MDRGVEGALHPTGCTAKFDDRVSLVDAHTGETVRRKPVLDSLQILRCRTEGCTELLWGEPLMKNYRSRILLACQKALKRCFLFRASAKQQQHPAHRLVRGNRAAIACCASQRMCVSAERSVLVVVDVSNNESGGSCRS